jgi:hypothetical protein
MSKQSVTIGLITEEEAYLHAQKEALSLLDKGFHMGGMIRATRDELHEWSDLIDERISGCRH